MKLTRRLVAGLLVGTFALLAAHSSGAAAGATLSGSGFIKAPGISAEFVVLLDDAHPLRFDYWDYSTDLPRVFSLDDSAQVDCLGQLFGGQTVRLEGYGLDSSSPNQTVSLQLFMVDGTDGPDQLSIKARGQDGRVLYFLKMRDLDRGELSVSCSG